MPTGVDRVDWWMSKERVWQMDWTKRPGMVLWWRQLQQQHKPFSRRVSEPRTNTGSEALPFGGTLFIVPHFSVSATDPRLNSLSLSLSLSTWPVCDLVRYCIPLLIILIRSFVVAVNGSTTTRDQSSSSTYLLEGHPLSPTAAYRREGPASG